MQISTDGTLYEDKEIEEWLDNWQSILVILVYNLKCSQFHDNAKLQANLDYNIG